MHICFVCASSATYTVLVDRVPAKTGGAELQMKLMSRMLSASGFCVDFIVRGPDGYGTELTSDGIRVTRGIPSPSGPRFYRTLYPWFKAFGAMRSVGADVYYQRAAGRVTGVVGLFCRRRGVPFVYGCAHNMDVDGSYEQSCGPVDRYLYRKALASAGAVIVQTEEQKALLKRNYDRDGVLIRNMYPMPESSDAGGERDAVIWVGSFRAVKRPEMFAELAAQIPDRRFIMVGGRFAAEAELYDRVVERAEQIPNLTLTGQLPYDEVANYYRRALVFVNTSSAEGFPNTFLQAWSVGTPTVATFDPDGVIDRYGLGLYCNGLDSLVATLKSLLTDNETRIAMGEQAIAYVRDHHDPRELTNRLAELLCSLATD